MELAAFRTRTERKYLGANVFLGIVERLLMLSISLSFQRAGAFSYDCRKLQMLELLILNLSTVSLDSEV